MRYDTRLQRGNILVCKIILVQILEKSQYHNDVDLQSLINKNLREIIPVDSWEDQR